MSTERFKKFFAFMGSKSLLPSYIEPYPESSLQLHTQDF